VFGRVLQCSVAGHDGCGMACGGVTGSEEILVGAFISFSASRKGSNLNWK